jgi:CheY-like chemotaxis protein
MKDIQILLAEDNRGDVLLVQEALAAHGISYQLHVAANGADAIQFMQHMGQLGEPPCPDLLLLDLNLPKVDGSEVLQEFRKHPSCTTTPIIVISSSDAPRDRQKIEALGVSRVFRKPTSFDAFLELGAVVKEVIDGK